MDRKILTEEEYQESLRAIIHRDYFPLVAQVRGQVKREEGSPEVDSLNAFQSQNTTEDDYAAERLIESDRACSMQSRYKLAEQSAIHNSQQLDRRMLKHNDHDGLILHFHNSESALMFGVKAGKPLMDMPSMNNNELSLATQDAERFALERTEDIVESLRPKGEVRTRYDRTDLPPEVEDISIADDAIKKLAESKRMELEEKQLRMGKFTKELDSRIIETHGVYTMQDPTAQEQLAHKLTSTIKTKTKAE